MDNNIARETKAYIVEEEGKTRIFIGNMHLEIVEEDDKAGPLGWEDGQDPGIIFWKHDFIKQGKGVFEHSTGRPVTFEKLRKDVTQDLRELLQQ